MYAYTHKPGADFSRGMQVRESAYNFSRPTPTLAFANGSMPISPQVILATASLCIHRFQYLVAGNMPQVRC